MKFESHLWILNGS